MNEIEVIQSILDKSLIERIPALSDKLASASVDRLNALLSSISENEWRKLNFSNIRKITSTTIGVESAIYLDRSGYIVFDKGKRDTLINQGATPSDEIVEFEPIPCKISWMLNSLFLFEDINNPTNSYSVEVIINTKPLIIPPKTILSSLYSGEGDIPIQIRFNPDNVPVGGKVIIQDILIQYFVI